MKRKYEKSEVVFAKEEGEYEKFICYLGDGRVKLYNSRWDGHEYCLPSNIRPLTKRERGAGKEERERERIT